MAACRLRASPDRILMSCEVKWQQRPCQDSEMLVKGVCPVTKERFLCNDQMISPPSHLDPSLVARSRERAQWLASVSPELLYQQMVEKQAVASFPSSSRHSLHLLSLSHCSVSYALPLKSPSSLGNSTTRSGLQTQRLSPPLLLLVAYQMESLCKWETDRMLSGRR